MLDDETLTGRLHGIFAEDGQPAMHSTVNERKLYVPANSPGCDQP